MDTAATEKQSTPQDQQDTPSYDLSLRREQFEAMIDTGEPVEESISLDSVTDKVELRLYYCPYREKTSTRWRKKYAGPGEFFFCIGQDIGPSWLSLIKNLDKLHDRPLIGTDAGNEIEKGRITVNLVE